MPITEDATALVSGADMVRWFLGLFAAYLITAFWLGLRTRILPFWKVLGGLSLSATFIWLLLSVALSYLVIMDKPSYIAAESYALSVTFGRPWGWQIAAHILATPNAKIPVWLDVSLTSATVAVILFVFALLPYVAAQMLSRARRGIHQHGVI